MANTFGGVAQAYCRWKIIGEPFKDGKVMYIEVQHPITKQPKKVRWYTDKKHADLMPKTKPDTPFHTLFGFSDKSDTIVAIRDADLSAEEVNDNFASKWRHCVFFGGVWYAPRGTSLPPIRRATKYFAPTWADFKAEGQKNSTELGMVSAGESPWFKD